MTVKSLIRSLPVPVEFCVVMVIGFGLAIVANVAMLFRQASAQRAATVHADIGLTNSGIVTAVVFQLCQLGIILWIGRIRGWSLKSFGLRLSWRLTAGGVLLFALQMLYALLPEALAPYF